MLRNEFYAKLGLEPFESIQNINEELKFLSALINMRDTRIGELENYVRILETRLERFTDDSRNEWDEIVDA